MKKFFIALSVMAALIFSVVPSQAIIGVPDVDALGTDAVVPFITGLDYENKTGLNTLMVFTDAQCGWAGSTGKPATIFHYVVYTVRSATVHNANLEGTPCDITSTDAYSILADMSPGSASQPVGRKMLEVDIDGDGTMDHYAGYIRFTAQGYTKANSTGGQFYFVDLAKGLATAANIPMKEYMAAGTLNAGVGGFDDAMLARPGQAEGTAYTELFSAYALKGAQDLQAGLNAPVAPTSFAIYPRYYIPASGDTDWLMVWMSTNDLISKFTATGGIESSLHVNWYDNEENKKSTNIMVPNEFTIINVEPLIPESLYSPTTYPKEGWMEMDWYTTDGPLQRMEILAWTLDQAYGSVTGQNMSWSTITPVWRAVNVSVNN